MDVRPAWLVLWFAGALAVAGDEQFPAVRAQASALLRQGKIAAAVPMLERAFKLNPPDYPNGYDLALAYLNVGRIDDARRQAKLLGDKAEVDSLLGDIETAAGKPDAALAHLRRAAERDPNEKYLLTLGNFLVSHGASADAVKIYQWAIERYPKSSPLRVGLGVALYARSEYDQAVQSLCDAVDLNPNDPRPLEFLGKMHDVSPQMATQVSARLKGLADRYPRNSLAHFYYGLSLWKLEENQPGSGDLDSAEKHLVTAVRLNPRFTEAQLQLGTLYEKRQKDILAAQALESTIKLDPKSEKALYKLAQVYRRLGRPEDSQRAMAAFRRLKDAEKQ